MAGTSDATSPRARARRRRVQGAAVSTSALVAGQLAAAVPPAQAAVYTVTSTADDGSVGTLRQAIEASNASTGVNDVINITATGLITLGAGGQIPITDDVIITGPGAALLSVDAHDASRVFYVHTPTGADDRTTVTISGLAVENGAPAEATGGNILAVNAELTLNQVVVESGLASVGGGILAEDSDLVITSSVVTGNEADGAGGGVYASNTNLLVVGSQFDHNGIGAGAGGGLAIGSFEGDVTTASVHDTLFEDNDSFVGGALAIGGEVSGSLTASTLQHNDASGGGGLFVSLGCQATCITDGAAFTVSDSTISENSARAGGGVLSLFDTFFGTGEGTAPFVIERSTISGNTAGEGGGLAVYTGAADEVAGAFAVTVTNSTISGNTADGGEGGGGIGGGIVLNGASPDAGSVTVEHSTIAQNSASIGGGIARFASFQAPVLLDHTIVANNVAEGGGSQDIALEAGDLIDASYALVTDGAAAVTLNVVGGATVVGDPGLEPLADNGGVTQTHMIPADSIAFNAGDPAYGNPGYTPPPIYDQRGLARVSGSSTGVGNQARIIDIGAVERQLVASSLPAAFQSLVWNLRESLSTGPYTIDPFTFGVQPMVPIMGDWDGDGDKTPGYSKSGTFVLSNSLAPTSDITFSFGHPSAYPVVGDWDGDGDDEVAVYRNGGWDVRATTTPANTTHTQFSLGSGSWPATVPVAGDWDGNGTDGVGVFVGSTGTWTLRPTATASATGQVSFVYEPVDPGYPVVGDWNGDGIDTVGSRNGTTWRLSNGTGPPAPAVDPDFTFDFQVTGPYQPLVWAYGTDD